MIYTSPLASLLLLRSLRTRCLGLVRTLVQENQHVLLGTQSSILPAACRSKTHTAVFREILCSPSAVVERIHLLLPKLEPTPVRYLPSEAPAESSWNGGYSALGGAAPYPRQESSRSRLHHTTGSPTLIALKLSPSLGPSGSLVVRTCSMPILSSEVEPFVYLGSPRTAVKHVVRPGPRTAASNHSFDPLAPFFLGHSSGSSEPAASVRAVGSQASDEWEQPAGSPLPVAVPSSEQSTTAPVAASQFATNEVLSAGQLSAAAALASKLVQALAADPVLVLVEAVIELLDAPEPAAAQAAAELVPEEAAAAEWVTPSTEPLVAAEPEREKTREVALDEPEGALKAVAWALPWSAVPVAAPQPEQGSASA
ncbi:hypothetical protein PC119_g15698 [Phytophthora cactorum]|uniref:Uncharacterized protein n=1 Tax=Phytophthora cactorum TaxID=29920 RepID=A0A8T1C2G9_9STRA|nr:hypothetical protein PC117_g18487 [Phytophthora cactorum]KAG3004155.1 hypothetical protein PC119_g15698 [Phytophthora cactorum]